MGTKINIEFSVAEVNQSIIVEGNPPVARLLPKHHAVVEGKTPYTGILCEKLANASPNKSDFSITKGFTTSNGITRAYVLCQHKTRMPVQFTQIGLQVDHPLRMQFIMKCDQCAQPVETPPIAQVAAVAPENEVAAPEAAQPIIMANINAPNEITRIFQLVATDIFNILNREHHLCSADVLPLMALHERQDDIEQRLVTAWRGQMRDALPVRIENDDQPDIIAQQREEQQRLMEEEQQRLMEDEQQQQHQAQNVLRIMMSNRATRGAKQQKENIQKNQSAKRGRRQ